MSDLRPYQTDHLFLLIGANPLPNYVAARLLAKQVTTIWLLHSDGAEKTEPSTREPASRLKAALEKLKREDKLGFQAVHLQPIPSADNDRIERTISQLLRDEGVSGTVGLHYTGGTKPMAVHVYRALEHAWAKKSPPPIFSYLDPRKLALRVDSSGTRSSELIPVLADEALRAQVEMKLNDLVALHGYKPISDNRGWADNSVPGLLELCAPIAAVNTIS